MSTERFHAEYAWLPGHDSPLPDVLIEVTGGRFSGVTAGVQAPPGVRRLPGVSMPGLANAHSHAFHRALRGHTQTDGGTFWTWRDRMYEVAARLDPDTYLALARATYAEMALAGITCVGEFHYLHHQADGSPYADPSVMGAALVEAAAQAGIRLTLLDTLYLTSTVDGEPLHGVQRRFGDRDVDAWSDRHARLPAAPHLRLGAALHSVRAVPLGALSSFAYRNSGDPLHFHLSEQRAENDACLATHGCTPTQLLADMGVLGPNATAVHATHLTDNDVALLGEAGAGACLCPTTERDLADGIGPARALADAGCPLSLGSDSHAVIDLFEEARAVELDERLRTERRGHFTPAELTHAATAAGHAALGWADAGTIAVGSRADLVTVRLDSVRTAAVPPAGVFFAATAADVTDVLVDGRVVVRDGRHVTLDVAAQLGRSIAAVWS